MRQLILIAFAGGLGAITRYSIAIASKRFFTGSFPYGTLIVNISGCFLLGLIAALSTERIPQQLKIPITAGFLGALTTFSTFGNETAILIKDNQTHLALLNITLNLVPGILAAFAGMYLAKTISS